MVPSSLNYREPTAYMSIAFNIRYKVRSICLHQSEPVHGRAQEVQILHSPSSMVQAQHDTRKDRQDAGFTFVHLVYAIHISLRGDELHILSR